MSSHSDNQTHPTPSNNKGLFIIKLNRLLIIRHELLAV